VIRLHLKRHPLQEVREGFDRVEDAKTLLLNRGPLAFRRVERAGDEGQWAIGLVLLPLQQHSTHATGRRIRLKNQLSRRIHEGENVTVDDRRLDAVKGVLLLVAPLEGDALAAERSQRRRFRCEVGNEVPEVVGEADE